MFYLRIYKYAKKVKTSKDQIESSIQTLKNKSTISQKTKGKISKLEQILKNLTNVLNLLRDTQADINNTLATLQEAIKGSSQ